MFLQLDLRITGKLNAVRLVGVEVMQQCVVASHNRFQQASKLAVANWQFMVMLRCSSRQRTATGMVSNNSFRRSHAEARRRTVVAL